ncbi:cell division protein PerM [Gordonia sp. MMO-8]|uniref:cell division protein PerM n=1 Tax=Gordonia sp. MMO-8 TaxID=3127886 RepID=UPI0030177B57
MSPTPNSLAARLRQVRLTRRADVTPRKAATWDLVKVALLSPMITVIVIAVIIGIIRLLAGDGLSGLGSAVAAGWLAVNQVPVTIGGITLGILPLLPTLLAAAGTAKVVAEGASTARELPDLIGIVGAALGGSMLVTTLSLAVIADGSAVTPIGQPDSLQAFGYTLLVQGAAVLVGVAIPSLKPILAEFAVPATERVGARGGLIAFGLLAAGGAVAVFVGLVTHWGAMKAMIADGNTVDGYLGLTVLSVLYLPNMIVGATAISTGASAQLGTTILDAFDVARGEVPPLPVVAALPETSIGSLGALFFLVPLIAGAFLGWYCRSDDPVRHLRAIGIGAAVAAALMVTVAWVSGGRLGELGHSGVNVPTTGVFTFAWLALGGALVVAVLRLADGGLTGRRRAADEIGDDLDDWFDVPASTSDDAPDAGDASDDVVPDVAERKAADDDAALSDDTSTPGPDATDAPGFGADPPTETNPGKH